MIKRQFSDLQILSCTLSDLLLPTHTSSYKGVEIMVAVGLYRI